MGTRSLPSHAALPQHVARDLEWPATSCCHLLLCGRHQKEVSETVPRLLGTSNRPAMTFLNRHLKRHRALGLCAFMLVCGVSTAQQDLQMSLSALSPMSINPAASGMNDGFKVTSLTRLQWLGWDGAAKTQVATVDAPFFRGFGGSGFALTQDLVGSRSFTSATFSGAAHLPISEEHRVSFGLCGSLRRHGIDFSGLRVHDATDVAFCLQLQGLVAQLWCWGDLQGAQFSLGLFDSSFDAGLDF